LPYDPSLASQLQLSDTLIVLNHAQALIENPDMTNAVLRTLGTARLLLVAEHPSPQFTQMTHLRVPELTREAALAYLAYEAARLVPRGQKMWSGLIPCTVKSAESQVRFRWRWQWAVAIVPALSRRRCTRLCGMVC